MTTEGSGESGRVPHSGLAPIRCLEVTGSLRHEDRQRRQVFEITVPTRASRLRIEFHYGPGEIAGVHNLLTLSVFDPRGFRGAAHRWSQAQTITLDPYAATPGFLPGPIVSGRWRIELDAHEIVNDGDDTGWCDFRLAVDAELDPVPDDQDAPGLPRGDLTDGARLSGAAGWYRGDLHSHSVHCDGTSTIAEMAGAAAAVGLEFLATTGHNTISQWLLGGPWPDGLLRIRGIECTTYFGHANVLGTSDWVDWRVESPELGARMILAQAAAQGALAVVNHPCALGNPVCTGCRWGYPPADLPDFDAIEVWNSGWREGGSRNVDALALWTSQLMAGSTLTAVAGTDSHAAEEYLRSDLPYNWVYADELSEREVLTALRLGRVYLSCGPTVTFVAGGAAGDRATLPGDRLPAGRFDLRVHAAGLTSPATAWLVVDGAPRRIGDLLAPGGTLHAAATAERWWRHALRPRDADEGLLALTNPVYHG
ncbi:MAG: CehA/McbA family metallohydrolase [Actinomycetota bacterium]